LSHQPRHPVLSNLIAWHHHPGAAVLLLCCPLHCAFIIILVCAMLL
jgi:hypothetical protein